MPSKSYKTCPLIFIYIVVNRFLLLFCQFSMMNAAFSYQKAAHFSTEDLYHFYVIKFIKNIKVKLLELNGMFHAKHRITGRGECVGRGKGKTDARPFDVSRSFFNFSSSSFFMLFEGAVSEDDSAHFVHQLLLNTPTHPSDGISRLCTTQ
jgi:hypothetical protein